MFVFHFTFRILLRDKCTFQLERKGKEIRAETGELLLAGPGSCVGICVYSTAMLGSPVVSCFYTRTYVAGNSRLLQN
jgi:hypothetical protein